MATVSITIDGTAVEAEENRSLLDVARENGKPVPSLCHDPRLVPFGACRMCLVEVEGARRPVPACATKVTAGMVVQTDTADLKTLRKTALELLLATHSGDCEAPCRRACPAGIDIQGFVALIADGQPEAAARLIREQLPFPASVGRVCPAFCERECRRNLVDEPVAICDLKRWAGDSDLEGCPDPLPASGFRVAVVGGGPAGLTAAYYLALAGHAVTLLEAEEKPGGMMRYGIPAYRLPKDLLDRELAAVLRVCREVRTGTVLGRDCSLDDLAGDFDAVFLAIGAGQSRGLGVPGEDLAGVHHGINFLRDVAAGREIRPGDRVAVVGGGNTAIDCARTALRLGSREVFVLYRRSEKEMPASAAEVAEAREEGVVFQFLVNPTAITGDGRVQSCRLVRMALGEPGADGRRRPVAVPGSEFALDVDTVICAVGQTVDASTVPSGRELLKNVGETQATSLAGVFAGGDCTTGPATVVEAVAAGKRAALSIDRYLQRGEAGPPRYDHSRGGLADIPPENYRNQPLVARTPRTSLPGKTRKNGFAEVTGTFAAQAAQKEALRCLSCGCLRGFDCALRDLATQYGVKQDELVPQKRAPFFRESHPYIVRDLNKCILCGSCVRICSEVQGIGALGFVGRGFSTVVQPSFGIPLSETACDSCGQCVSACPTGAITAGSFAPKPIPWKGEKVATVCPQCSINCDLELKIAGRKIIGAAGSYGSVNEGNLCKKGSFGYGFVHGGDRITRPLVRKEGRLVETTWPAAMAAASQGLGRIRDVVGPDALAVLASPNLTCEEGYLVRKLARQALRTESVGSVRPLVGAGLTDFPHALPDLAKADLVVVYKTDPAVDYPVLGNRLRKMRGARLVFIGPRVTRFTREAAMTLRVSHADAPFIPAGVLNYYLHYDLLDAEELAAVRPESLGAQIANLPFYALEDLVRLKPARLVDLAHLYLRAKNPVIVADGEMTDARELQMLRLLFRVKPSRRESPPGVFLFYPYGNPYGQASVGISPEFPAADALDDDRIMGLVSVVNDGLGLEGLIRKNVFNVVITPRLTGEVEAANVILPAATFAETQGTFRDAAGRYKTLNRALPPPGGKENWLILAELGAALGGDPACGDLAEVAGEMAMSLPSRREPSGEACLAGADG